jgi:hypothetical protein
LFLLVDPKSKTSLPFAQGMEGTVTHHFKRVGDVIYNTDTSFLHVLYMKKVLLLQGCDGMSRKPDVIRLRAAENL